ncbi:protein shortage in chiasmata 1 ortholog-like [Styela clava]
MGLGIRHIALEIERTESQLDMDGDTANNDDCDVITLIGSSTITQCGNLLHLLETRHNIEILERDYVELNKSISPNENLITGYPDIIIDQTTCIIVETFSALSGEDGSQLLHNIILKILDLKTRFTKRYVIIADLFAKKSGYPMSGDFPLNLSKLHTALENFLQQDSVFEMKLFCCFDVEHFAYLIQRLVENSKSDKSMGKELRMERLTMSQSSHEKFLVQFPSINSLVAQNMLSIASLKEIASMSISELLERFSHISKECLQDFHSKLHAPGQSLPAFYDEIDVDVTPEFSFKLEQSDSMEMGKSQDEFPDFAAYFGREYQSKDSSDCSSSHFSESSCFQQSNPFASNFDSLSCSSKHESNPCRKRLRFERIKEWKDGQTRLVYY